VTDYYTAAFFLQAAAGASGSVTALTAPEGHRWKVKNIYFNFPFGTGCELAVQVWVGDEQFSPDEGSCRGDAITLFIPVDKSVSGGSKFVVRYVNENTTAARKAVLVFILKRED